MLASVVVGFLACTGSVVAEDVNVKVTVTKVSQTEGISVTVEPWRAQLSPGDTLSWAGELRVEGSPSRDIELGILLEPANPFPGKPPGVGKNPKTPPMVDVTPGSVFYYSIEIPHPDGSLRNIKIDPEYERKRREE